MRTRLTLFLLFTLTFLQAQLSQYNDEFDDASTLSNWLNINDTEGWNAEHLEAYDIDSTIAGHLMMMPYTSVWFNNYRGTLLYKLLSGNFVATIEVEVTNRAGNGLPSSDYSLAGIMIRRPRIFPNGALGAGGWTAGAEDYAFLSTGYASTGHPSCWGCQGPHFEVKATENSNSNLAISSLNSQRVIIRLARIDEYVIVLYQEPSEDFVVHRRYDETDVTLPDEVQIGLVTYTDWPKGSTYDEFFQNSHVINADLNPDPSSNPWQPFNPDVVGMFNFIRFDEVTVPEQLEGIDLKYTATDEDLLSFLGYPSEAALPVEWMEFYAEQKKEAVQLHWSTAAEYTSAYFEVEYSTTGKSFATVGKVTSAGTRLGRSSYTFAHQPASARTHYYRLKQFDEDGHIQYSKTIAVKGQHSFLTLTPTLSDGFVQVRSEQLSGEIYLELWDMSGRLVHQENWKAEESTDKTIDLQTISPGMYVVKLRSAQGEQVEKLVLF